MCEREIECVFLGCSVRLLKEKMVGKLLNEGGSKITQLPLRTMCKKIVVEGQSWKFFEYASSLYWIAIV